MSIDAHACAEAAASPPTPGAQPTPAGAHDQALADRLGRLEGRIDMILASLQRSAAAHGSDGAP